jgi:acyl carrier protein
MDKKFIDIMADILEVSVAELNDETVFREVADFDSLCSLSTISSMDDLYGRSLSADELGSVTTLGELFRLVN